MKQPDPPPSCGPPRPARQEGPSRGHRRSVIPGVLQAVVGGLPALLAIADPHVHLAVIVGLPADLADARCPWRRREEAPVPESARIGRATPRGLEDVPVEEQ